MKKYLVVIMLLALAGTSFSCSTKSTEITSEEIASQNGPITKDVSPKEFAELIKNKKNAILLDVRTPKEVASEHLVNSTHLDFFSNSFKSELEKLDKSKTVLVYCLSGGRSGKTMTVLKEMGFKEIYNLEGGIAGWKEAGLPLEE